MSRANEQTDLSILLHKFFTCYLVQQRRLSHNTIATYRDTIKLYLSFLSERSKTVVASLMLKDIDKNSIIEFLEHLETDRNNCTRTRNNRLAALRCFVNFAATEMPSMILQASQILSVPQKRWDRPLLGHLERKEIEALINATDLFTWSGERDHVMLLLFYNTGARVAEVILLKRNDIDIHRQHTVHFIGKGRKERVVPLWPRTVKEVKSWLAKIPQAESTPLFPNRFGEPLTRSGVRQRLIVAQRRAMDVCPSLRQKHITPHTLRHTTAMHLLQSGVDLSLIALWLGHEHIDTTHQYMEANLDMKKVALEALKPIDSRGMTKFKAPSDEVLAFLENL